MRRRDFALIVLAGMLGIGALLTLGAFVAGGMIVAAALEGILDGLNFGPPPPTRAETELRVDGSVSRTVQQEDLAGTAAEWDGVRPVRAAPAENWNMPLATVPTDRDGDAWIAWGDFPSPAAIPDHLKDGAAGPTRLVRTPTVTDHGLVREYRWRETVLPSGDLASATAALQSARAALLAEWIDYRAAVLAEGLPEGTNIEPLIQWLRTDGDALTEKLLLRWLSLIGSWGQSGGQSDLSDAEARRWLDLLRQHGLDLSNEDSSVPTKDEIEERIGPILEEFIRARAFGADGEPVDAETAERIRRLLVPSNVDSLADAPGGLSDAERTAIETAAAVALYGSTKAKDDRFAALEAAAAISLWAVIASNNDFALRHTMPGVLLETNGLPLSDGGTDGSGPAEVLFRFQHLETLPHGREMFARSALVDETFQQKLLGSVPVRTREEIETFFKLVADPDAAAVWAECLERESVEPLRGWTDGAAGQLRDLLLGGGGAAGDGAAVGG
ncbi:hypothetical protein [Alienimonas sp. DA493]|uniref:hypothetical protein n=1 Tax=Alienimonas sp. DA493 TaxID=3373605 RepID=UPI0037552901